MMDAWLAQLQHDLDHRAAQHLRRRLQPLDTTGRLIHLDGQPLVNLASNDYLGISRHPQLQQAAINAIQAHGTGAGASRLVSGHLTIHERVEQRFAAFKHAQAALMLPTGYMANLAVLTSMAGPGDLICLDKLNHASLLDAAAASGARVRVYPHLQTTKLARLLARHAASDANSANPNRAPRRFIVTDSVFSMDGDVADLPTLCDLADRYDAILVVDEAHATGVLGPTGAGLCDHQGVAHRVDIVVSTASKALGGLGGVVTGRSVVIQTLVNHARSFIYTTAPAPAQVASLGGALDVIRDEPHRRQRLTALSQRLRTSLLAMGVVGPATLNHSPVATPIVPIVVRSSHAALALAQHLRTHGFFAPAIRPPTVPPGAARVRISLRADLQDDDLARLIQVLTRYPLDHAT